MMDLNSRKALYFPYLTIRDLGWLKYSALFWDKILRIAPIPGFHTEKVSDVEQALKDECGFIEDVTWLNWRGITFHACESLVLMYEHAKRYPSSPFRYLTRPNDSPYFTWEGYEDLKLGAGYWLRVLLQIGAVSGYEGHVVFGENAGMTYMSIMADQIARRRELDIVTDDIRHAEVLDLVRLTSPLQQDLYVEALCSPPRDSIMRTCFDTGRPISRKNINLPDPNLNMGLCRMAFDSIGVPNPKEVSIKQIIRFRTKYDAERKRYFNAITRLTDGLDKLQTPEAFEDRIETVTNDIKESIRDFRKALKDLKIESILNWSAVSLSFPIADAIAARIPASKPLLVGIGLSLGVLGAIHKGRKAGKNLFSSNPWAYLYLASKKLKPRTYLQRLLAE